METPMSMSRHRFTSNAPRVVGWVIGGIILAVIFAFIFGYFVMLLWNWLMPVIFGLPEINYWMGFGIIILAKLLFGVPGHGHSHKDNHHDRYFSSKFKRKFKPPFDKMSKWHFYDEYWKEEGEAAFNQFVEKKKAGQNGEKENPAE